MRAMALTRRGSGKVESVDFDLDAPGPTQVLVRVLACGVCRTDLHVVDGDLPDPAIPVVPGHEIVGRVEEVGEQVKTFSPGDRIGVPWLGWSCGECEFCRAQRENLCPRARFTGYHLNGGYAERAVADARFCFRLPDAHDDQHAAPLLCAGLIGYRACGAAVGRSRPGALRRCPPSSNARTGSAGSDHGARYGRILSLARALSPTHARQRERQSMHASRCARRLHRRASAVTPET